MLSILAFIYCAITILIWTRCFENYKAKVHQLDTKRQNEIKEHLSYQDQYWGMLLSGRKSFPLYREELEPYIKKVRSKSSLVMSGFVITFLTVIIEDVL